LTKRRVCLLARVAEAGKAVLEDFFLLDDDITPRPIAAAFTGSATTPLFTLAVTDRVHARL
jgi:hypothetical protein